MKLVKKIFFLITVGFTFSAAGQNTGFYWENLKESSNRLQGKIMGEIYFIDPLSSQFFFLQDDWVEGTLELADGDIYENILIRYNCKEDNLIAYNKRIRTLYTIDKNILSRFRFKDYYSRDQYNETEFIKLYFNGLRSEDRFFEILYSGQSFLLAFHYIDEMRVAPYVDRHGRMSNTEYKKRTNYFIYNSNKQFKKVNPKRRSVLKAFPDNKKVIKKIIRQNKVFIQNNEQSLIQAIKLIDQAGLMN